MSNQKALEAINTALKGSPEIELYPLQTLDKSLIGSPTLWFTLCKRGENKQRKLYLHFDPTMEVRLPGPAYLRECQSQIAKAISGFWYGATSEHSRIVEIPTFSDMCRMISN